jgi:hypothetical protein
MVTSSRSPFDNSVLVVIDSKSIDEKSSLAMNRIDETGTVDGGFPERSSFKQTAPADED